MKNILKTSLAAAAAMALATSAHAAFTQGLTISDGINTITLSGTSGALTYDSSISGAIGGWTIVVTSGTASPPLPGGNVSTPNLDLQITALYTVSGTGSTLTATFFGTGYGPTTGTGHDHLTAHMATGTGGGITFNSYYSALNNGATTTLINASGTLNPDAGGNYLLNDGAGSINGSLYSLTEVVTVSGTVSRGVNAGKYSIDASLNTVPDGGTTLVLLGSALFSLALLRKRFIKA